MASLTVAEKEHWKKRIELRIDKRIEAVLAADPGLVERVARTARERAIASLGLAELEAARTALAVEQDQLWQRQETVEKAMAAVLRRCRPEDVTVHGRGSLDHELAAALERRQRVHEDELLAAEPVGQEVLRLRREKEELLDTVWLATSRKEVRELWQKVTALVSEEPTRLQREVLASALQAA